MSIYLFIEFYLVFSTNVIDEKWWFI